MSKNNLLRHYCFPSILILIGVPVLITLCAFGGELEHSLICVGRFGKAAATAFVFGVLSTERPLSGFGGDDFFDECIKGFAVGLLILEGTGAVTLA